MAGSIFRLPEMIAYTKLSRSAIYDRMNESSPRYDPTFPKKFQLGGGAIGWFKDDIDAWLANCAGKPHRETSSEPHSVSATPENAYPQSSSVEQNTQSRTKPPNPATRWSTNPASSKSDANSVARQPNLGELIIEGANRNATLLKYLKLDAWTPVMGAMLVSGIQTPLNCNEIPSKCIGLDNKPLSANHSRIRKARNILEDWNAQNDPPYSVSPFEFLIWSQEEQINTEWLRLFLDLAGNTPSDTDDLTPSHFALLTARQS